MEAVISRNSWSVWGWFVNNLILWEKVLKIRAWTPNSRYETGRIFSSSWVVPYLRDTRLSGLWSSPGPVERVRGQRGLLEVNVYGKISGRWVVLPAYGTQGNQLLPVCQGTSSTSEEPVSTGTIVAGGPRIHLVFWDHPGEVASGPSLLWYQMNVVLIAFKNSHHSMDELPEPKISTNISRTES